MDILLVDNKKRDVEKVKRIIRSQDWRIDECQSGLNALNKMKNFSYDIIITDIYIPIIDGISLCALIKERDPAAKIIIVTSERHYYKKIQAFHAGASEYLTKPIIGEMLVAKIKSLAERKPLIAKVPRHLKAGDLVMNLETRKVQRSEQNIKLNKKEFNLLMYMMINNGKTLNRSTILEHVWEGDILRNSTNIVDVYINKLRNKIDTEKAQKIIRTVHGVGYTLEAV